MERDEGLKRLTALGFSAGDAEALWLHFEDAEQRGKLGHGHSRIPWLETLDGYDPVASPELVVDDPGYQRWHSRGAIGYLVLSAVVAAQIERPPTHARLVVCEQTFPTGMLGHHVRRLADAGLVGVLTATSPARLGPPGGPKVAGTNPLALGFPGGVVVDVSMGAVTWGDVIAGRASDDELVPFGGDQWHKAFALAVGLQLLVDSLVTEPGYGAALLVAKPSGDPVALLREVGLRLPGVGVADREADPQA